MKKSSVIANCLVNSNIIKRIEDAENAVQRVFHDEFPNSSFLEWNHEVDDKHAENIIKNVGRASRINVRKFIEDLW